MAHSDATTPALQLDTAPRGLPGLEAAIKARGYRTISHFAREHREASAPLYDIARGDVSPTADTIRRLARALDVSADALLGLTPIVDPAAVSAAVAAAAEELGSK